MIKSPLQYNGLFELGFGWLREAFCEAESLRKAHGVCRPGRDKLSARTCKKLPVASFCASETAETGRIANGREQGDHVGGDRKVYKGGFAAARWREAAKGFNWVSAKLMFGWADSRFAEPRISLWEGFNFVRVKPPLRRADSRFAKPRSSLQGNGFILFACTKRTKSTPEVCEPLDSGDDSKLCQRRFQQSFPATRAETGFSHKTAAKRL